MVYIVADLKLKEDEQRDLELIENWNSVVQDEDTVLLCGIITKSKEANSVRKIFNQLKGQKRIIDMSFRNASDVERFQYVTGNQPYQICGFVPGHILGKETHVMIPSNAEELKLLKSNGHYCAAPASLLQQEEIYQNGCLDISIEKWGDIPLLYTDIPVLINNLLTYDEELRRK